MEKTLQKAGPNLQLFFSLIVLFGLILAVYLRPSDYEIKKEIQDRISAAIEQKNPNVRNLLNNDLVDGIFWNSIDRSLEIKDMLFFKIFIIHLSGSSKSSQYGFGVFEKLDLDNIDWYKVIDDLGNKKVSDLLEPKLDISTTQEQTFPLHIDSAAKKEGEEMANSKIYQNKNTIYGIWTGKQPAYNVKNALDQDVIANGNPVITPACNWTLTVKEDGSISVEQFDPENQNTVFYTGNGGDDANISNGVILLHYTVSSSDRTSTFNLTLRLTLNNEGLCIPDRNNGPDFSITKEQ